MQTPRQVLPSRSMKMGPILALVGSVLTLISVLALPLISFYGTLTYTLVQGTSLFSSLSSSFSSNSSGGGPCGLGSALPLPLILAAIWSSLAIAALVAIIALIATIRPVSRSAFGAVGIIILSIIDAGIFAFFIIAISRFISCLSTILPNYGLSSGITVGIGGWLSVVGMVVALVGGIVALIQRHSLQIKRGKKKGRSGRKGTLVARDE